MRGWPATTVWQQSPCESPSRSEPTASRTALRWASDGIARNRQRTTLRRQLAPPGIVTAIRPTRPTVCLPPSVGTAVPACGWATRRSRCADRIRWDLRVRRDCGRIDLLMTALTAGKASRWPRAFRPGEVLAEHDVRAALLCGSTRPSRPRCRLEALGFRAASAIGPYQILLRGTSTGSGVPMSVIGQRLRSPVLVVGAYGYGNVGDEAILSGLLLRLEGHAVTVVSRSPGDTTALHGVRSIGIGQAVSALRHHRSVVIGGGGLFGRDMGRIGRLLPAFGLLAAALGKRVSVVGVDLDDRLSGSARVLVPLLMRAAAAIQVRDRASATVLAGWGASAGVEPDLSAWMEPRARTPVATRWRRQALIQSGRSSASP